jgi:hypothetical protein
MPITPLPPPPIRGQAGDFVWTAWQNNLYRSLSSPGTIAWTTIDKTGSSLADLQVKSHAVLTGVLGTGSYHMSSTEAANVTALPTASTIVTTANYGASGILSTSNYAANNIVDNAFKTKAGVPTTSDITAGKWAIYKDTSGGTLKLYANDGGTIKSVALV